MELEVTFPGNLKVDAQFKGFTISTDQPEESGGDGSAPSPFDLFIASVGTCAGFYVLSFCRQRQIPTDNIKVVQKFERDEGTHLIPAFTLEILVPADFPDKYKKAVIRAAEQCTVKKHLVHPPEIQIQVV